MKYQEFSKTPLLDLGCGLFYRDSSAGDKKYHILAPLEEVPSFQGEKEEIEYGYTTLSVTGKIEGRLSLEKQSTDFYWNRDLTNKFKSLAGKQLEFLIVLPNYQGYRVRGTLSYKYNNVARNELVKGTLTITPSWMDENHIDDVSEFIEDTAFIETALDSELEVSKSEPLVIDSVVTTPSTATIAVAYYTGKEYKAGETSSICTCVSAAGTESGTKKLTFTAGASSKAGQSEIVELSISADGYATEKQYFYVRIID